MNTNEDMEKNETTSAQPEADSSAPSPAAAAETSADAAETNADAAPVADSQNTEPEAETQSDSGGASLTTTESVQPAPAVAAGRRGGRQLRGLVVGDKADKTVRVEIRRQIKHPLYGKIIRRSRDVQAHDPENECRKGDWVILEEAPRFSKTKSWKVARRLTAKEIS